MLLKNLLLGVVEMEILKKLLNLIFEFLEARRQTKVEKEEQERVIVEQKLKTQEQLERRKKETVKPSTDDNFFGDL